jgi:hypothetical protein
VAGFNVGPEPELPVHLYAVMAKALEEGAKPAALSPLQARYGARPAARPSARAGMLAFAAGGAAMLIGLAIVGNPAPRAWLVQTVDSAAHRIGIPVASPAASHPSPEGPSNGNSHSSTAPGHQSPQPGDGHENGGKGTPGPKATPRPTPSPRGPGGSGHGQPSPGSLSSSPENP